MSRHPRAVRRGQISLFPLAKVSHGAKVKDGKDRGGGAMLDHQSSEGEPVDAFGFDTARLAHERITFA